ncbi:hypothetical protein LIER_27899 [Lithospermum erythrorhizon]|uniref:Uncharacterized protein n=1 Tax=Lithospermum erythrorhizon TaxID=34254 RepID=A0AAV3RH45_LITER
MGEGLVEAWSRYFGLGLKMPRKLRLMGREGVGGLFMRLDSGSGCLGGWDDADGAAGHGPVEREGWAAAEMCGLV